MRYLISVSYDGSKLFGFQRLNKHKTVQGELERVLTKINKTIVVVKGAGRTDRGVHAIDQKVHFDLSVNIEPEKLRMAINSRIDDAIYVNSCEIVADDFHARFDVKEKTYNYIINESEYDPLINDYVYNYNNRLNIKSMKKASKYFLGEHTFEAFTSGERENYNSAIYKIKITRNHGMINIKFVGRNFYRYMVRNMVGALIKIGQDKEKPEIIKEMLDTNKSKYNYTTAPANGLYLVNIKY